MRFIEHREVGQRLADYMASLAPEDPIVLAIPSGGVRIGWEIAQRLGAPMDVIVANEVTVPGERARASGWAVDGRFYPDRVGCRNLNAAYIDILASCIAMEQRRRERALRHGHAALDLAGKTVILVSDATPDLATLEAVITSLREREIGTLIYAAPVASPALVALVGSPARVVTMFRPEEFRSVMLVNARYEQTTDDEITELLERSWRNSAERRPGLVLN